MFERKSPEMIERFSESFNHSLRGSGDRGFSLIGHRTLPHAWSALEGDAIGLVDYIAIQRAAPASRASNTMIADDGFPAEFDLASLDGANGFRINGIDTFDYSGWSVASAGDVNGDGYDDIVIGAILAENYYGASYVVFGKGSGWSADVDLASLDGISGFTIPGDYDGDQAGRSVASAGDVNGDGFDDLIIGAINADTASGERNAGESYVIFGKSSGWTADFDLDSLNGANGFRIDGLEQNDHLGWSVSAAGDVNGDGFGDIIVGAPRADASAGTSYVIFGKASGFSGNFDLETLNGTNGFRFDGTAAQDFSGISVSSAGDINGDGYDDVVIGAYQAGSGAVSGAGESYVVFGKAAGFAARISPANLDGSNGFVIAGESNGDRAGRSVSSAGDINGDGLADIIIGARNVGRQGANSTGASYVVFGKPSSGNATIDLGALDGSNGFRIEGIDAYDYNGVSVSSAGDVNGDGFDDIIIGAPGADGYAGESYIIFGKVGGFDATVDLSSLDGNVGFVIAGADPADANGHSVAAAGDGNGDGFADVVIGAYNADSLAGESYVIFGHGPVSAVKRIGSVADQAIRGSAFNDTLLGLAGEDSLYGANGNDRLFGGDGSDVLFGQDGTDLLAGQAGNDTIFGGAGSDKVSGGAGNDLLEGEGGSDRLDGGSGEDFLKGGGGDDKLIDRDGGDTLFGGTGDDLFIVFDATADVREAAATSGHDKVRAANDFQLPDNVEDLVLLSGDTGGLEGTGNTLDNFIQSFGGDDRLLGRSGNDTLGGGGGNDTLLGGLGDDKLSGGNGNDMLKGNDGDDQLIGGAGVDTLFGGGGSDRFVFRGASLFDTIADFEDGTDRIALFDYRDVNGGAPLTVDLLLITQRGSDTRIELDLDKNGVADHIDLDGNGSADLWRIDLSNTDAADVTAADFLF